MWSRAPTQSAQISQKQDERIIYVIMKTMCPPGYHQNGFVATHPLGHVMYVYHELPQKPRDYHRDDVYTYMHVFGIQMRKRYK